jgi:drug/metabolite transporter (DMT)-like permease
MRRMVIRAPHLFSNQKRISIHMDKKSSLLSAVYIFLAGVIWSFTGVLVKQTSWAAYTLVGTRGLVAIIVIGLARKSFRIPTGKSVCIGALGLTSTSLLFMAANKLTSAANAIVLQYAAPIFVILFAFILYRQKPTRSEAVTVICVLAGVILCFVEGLGSKSILGDLLGLLSAVTYATVFIAAKQQGCKPMDYVYLGSLFSTLFLITIPFDSGFSITPSLLLVGLGMGLGLGFGYLFFALGLKGNISPITAVLVANTEPVLNPMWAFLFAGEIPGTFAFVGAAIVLLSVTLKSLFDLWQLSGTGKSGTT